MAMTEDEMFLLREWIQEPVSEEWNDDRLNSMFAIMGGDLKATAAAFWRSKASLSAGLVDVSENGSSRKLGDLYKNYTAIAVGFEAGEEAVVDVTARPTTRAIVRP